MTDLLSPGQHHDDRTADDPRPATTRRGPGPALTAAVGVVVAATIGLFLSARRVVGTDDFHFAKDIAQYATLSEWVAHRYEIWSGRIVPEAAIYLYTSAPLIWWQLTSVVLFLGFVGMLVAYHRLLHPTDAVRRLAPVVLTAAFVLFLAGGGAVRGGMLWVTGAMNYFWLVPFALAGMYPVAFVYARGRCPRWWVTAGAVVCAAVAAVSAEQVSAVMLVLLVVAVVDRAVVSQRTGTPRRADVGVLALLLLATAGAFAVLMGAPGNDIRTVIDARNWLPDYFDTPFVERVGYGVRFVVDGLVNLTGLVLPLLWSVLLVALARRDRRERWDLWDRGAAGLLALALAVSAARYLSGAHVVFDLHSGWKVPSGGLSSALVLAFWLVVLAGTAIAPLVLLRDRLGAALTLMVLGAYASLVAITLSPSMYASGPRVVFIPVTILVLVGFALFFVAFRVGERRTWWVVAAAAVPAVLQLGYLVDRMLQGLVIEI